uniref:Dynein light chain n=1 Tax=Capra hircus TaxID=9925 RepID=A0A8C2R8D7_CAPHI
MSDRKAVIKNADMSEDMQQDAVDCATQAMEKYNIEKDIAAYIKKEFDKKYNPTWHCIVGRNFGSYVTHETKHFIYFYLGQVAILLFKSVAWGRRLLYVYFSRLKFFFFFGCIALGNLSHSSLFSFSPYTNKKPSTKPVRLGGLGKRNRFLEVELKLQLPTPGGGCCFRRARKAAGGTVLGLTRREG